MEIYSMLVYNTIFFAECQDGNGFLFHFINFAQTQVIFYSKLTSKDIPFLLYMCSCFQSRSLQRKLCSISQLITFTKDGQELLPYIQKSRRGHLHNGKSPRRYSLIGYAAVWERPSVQLSIRINNIFGGRYKNIQIDRLCDKGMLFCNSPKISFFLITAGP